MLNQHNTRLLRHFCNLTQKELAYLTGLSEPLIASIKTGRRIVTYASEQKILNAISNATELLNQINMMLKGMGI